MAARPIESASCRMLPAPRALRLAFLVGLLLLLAGGAAGAQESRPTVGLIHVDGTITPVMATYIGRGIERAAERGDSAVVIQLDTPGGLSSAMDDIVADILNAPIPVIVWVAPDGARAASAGVYITYAAHIAAMAPATNIGSATPVQLGEDGSGDQPETAMDRKVINDAVGKIRSLAEKRGRNADWAEDAVRDAVNVSASQAAELGVIDFVAATREDLLRQADGREVSIGTERVRVNVAGADVRGIDMSLFERFLQVITDPNIALVLVSIGTLALIFELANPGSIGPGAIGALMLITGFYALGTLDTNWAGLALLGLALLLFAIDVFVPTHGVLTVSGIIAFVVGALLLSNTRNAEVLGMSRVVIFTLAALMGAFFLFIVGSAWRVRDLPQATGRATIVGAIATTRSELDPSGMVFLQGELWSATAADGPIALGQQVQVVAMDGLHLTVRRIPHEIALQPPGTITTVA